MALTACGAVSTSTVPPKRHGGRAQPVDHCGDSDRVVGRACAGMQHPRGRRRDRQVDVVLAGERVGSREDRAHAGQ